MNKKTPVCPNCSSVMTFYGEGSYGKCTNDKCRFEMKVDGCDTEPCDDYNLKHEDIEKDPES